MKTIKFFISNVDKNIGREQAAAEEFKEVCNAYTNLSDPQLRAFYDRNKESIISEGGLF